MEYLGLHNGLLTNTTICLITLRGWMIFRKRKKVN